MSTNWLLVGIAGIAGVSAAATTSQMASQKAAAASASDVTLTAAPPAAGQPASPPSAPTATAPAATKTQSAAKNAAATKATTLAPLDLSDMRLWNWYGKWTASQWSNPDSPIAWSYDHIDQRDNGNTRFTLNAKGAAQLQAEAGTAAHDSGLWEADVTLPKMTDGVIVAPLWLYDPATKDEIDFEFAGRNGLTVSLHSASSGQLRYVTVPVLKGQDLSGTRHRFGIKVDQSLGSIEMFVDQKSVYRWDRATAPFFVYHPLRPWMQIWAVSPSNVGLTTWVGKWRGLAAGDALVMVNHGYGYTDL